MLEKKNWLIRTQDFQILGPVSKSKILELLNNETLNPQDEVCCGNGFWFFIKEKDLVDKFIFGDEKQTFSHITEAKDVLNINPQTGEIDSLVDQSSPKEHAPLAKADKATPPSKMDKAEREKIQKINLNTGEEVCIPSQEDLEYPSKISEDFSDDDGEGISNQTLVGSLDMLKRKSDQPQKNQNAKKSESTSPTPSEKIVPPEFPIAKNSQENMHPISNNIEKTENKKSKGSTKKDNSETTKNQFAKKEGQQSQHNKVESRSQEKAQTSEQKGTGEDENPGQKNKKAAFRESSSHKHRHDSSGKIESKRTKKNDRYLFIIFIIVGIFLVLAVVSRKKIIDSFLSFEFSGLGIHDSFAGFSVDLIDLKKNLNSFEELNGMTGKLIPQFGMSGFSLLAKINNSKVSCRNFDSIFFQIQMTLMKKHNQMESIRPTWEECSSQANKHTKAVLELGELDIVDRKKLRIHLERYFYQDSDNGEIEKILEIYDKKTAQRKKNDYLKLLDKTVDLAENDHSKKEEVFFLCKDLLKLIENEHQDRRSPIIDQLIKIVVALKRGNYSWAKMLILEMLSKDRREYIFDMQNNYLGNNYKENDFKEKIFKIFQKIKQDLNDDKLFKLFLTFWVEVFQGEDQERLQQSYDIAWSLSEIRQMLDSPNEGVLLPSLWFPLFYKRAPFTEIRNFFEEGLSEKSLHMNGPHVLWMLKYYFPSDERFRKMIATELKKLNHSREWYEKYLVIEVMENKFLKTYMGQLDKEFQRPLDLWKKEFYKELLRSGEATEFAVYHLLKQGEKEAQLLWWVIL